jgi:hypothetical protein
LKAFALFARVSVELFQHVLHQHYHFSAAVLVEHGGEAEVNSAGVVCLS